MKKIILSIIGFAFLSTSSFAQLREFDPGNARDGETVEYCHSHKKHAELLANPDAVASFVEDALIRKNEGNDAPKATLWTIPVVFHILHDGGSENISDEQVYRAVEIMNRDYARLNDDADDVHANFQGVPAAADIQFVLATTAPDGSCFKGITRTQNSITFNAGTNTALSIIKNNNDVWTGGEWNGLNGGVNREYLHIFVAAEIGGAAGYTYTPSNWIGPDMDNGIWVLHTYVGDIGTGNTSRSRTLTHEAGHWLNLEHVWGGTNNPALASNCNSDDGIDDTPDCIGSTSCVLSSNTCTGDNGYWGFDQIDPVENYMDYSYCSKMFTPGQVTRMRNALNSSVGGRNQVKTAQNLANTGADGNTYLCKADFTASKTTVCVGETVDFTDLSYNKATGWTWSFPGGVASSTTEQNPTVTYSTPGLYAVTLDATDGIVNDGETKVDYIRVLPASGVIPFLEGFENFTSFGTTDQFEVINYDGNNTWEVSTAAPLTGARSARILNYNQPVGSFDELISAPIDLSGITTSATMSFRYAYKRKSTSDDDWVKVYATANCGSSWAVRKTMHGIILSNQTQNNAFTPSSAADWKTVHMTNLTSAYWVENFRYKFEFEAGGGNNFYLDNINIYEGTPTEDLMSAGISEDEIINGFNVYPNPADKEVNISFNVNDAQNAIVRIQSVTGQQVQSHLIQANAGANLVFVDTSDLSTGMYFVEVEVAGTKQTVQLAIK